MIQTYNKDVYIIIKNNLYYVYLMIEWCNCKSLIVSRKTVYAFKYIRQPIKNEERETKYNFDRILTVKAAGLESSVIIKSHLKMLNLGVLTIYSIKKVSLGYNIVR